VSTPDNAERLRQLDADLLMALDALLRDQNVTQAAKRLGISQSAMSARLTRLRSLFEDRLFVAATTGRGVIATPRALAMRNAVSTALAALETLVKPDADFDARSSTKTFRLAMHDNPAALVAPGLVARCRTLAPNVKVAIVHPDTQKIAAAMESGEIDVLIASPTTAHAGWMSRAIFKERFATAQRKNHPRGAGPLDLDTYCALDHLIVSADGGGFTGLVDDLLTATGRERRVTASVQSYALAPLIVEASDLLCTLPKHLLQRFGQALDLFDPPFELQDFQLSAFWHARNQDDPAHTWLRERISEAAREATSI
jgi:DNA-binding transcriptional LysR family regulator